MSEGSVHVSKPPKSLFRWPTWRPTSSYALYQAEQDILSSVKAEKRQEMIPLFTDSKGRTHYINTVMVGSDDEDKPPLVMLHGFGGAVGFWVKSLDVLSKHYRIYAIDLLGFGRSSRMPFQALSSILDASENASAADQELLKQIKKNKLTAEVAEAYFVRTLELWRQRIPALENRKLTLLGHSMGGYLASSYVMHYPQNIDRLVLADPWGFPEPPADPEANRRRLPLRYRVMATMYSWFSPNPLSVVRGAGPAGPWLIRKTRPDFQERFADCFQDNRILDYIYHISAQAPPTGEAAFQAMTKEFGYASRPMLPRIKDAVEKGTFPSDLPVLILRGSRSWMRAEPYVAAAVELAKRQSKAHTIVRECHGGHHIYSDDADSFHAALLGDAENASLFRNIFVSEGSGVELPQKEQSRRARPAVTRPLDRTSDADEQREKAEVTVTRATIE